MVKGKYNNRHKLNLGYKMSEISILIAISFIIFSSPYIAKKIKIPVAPTEILLGMLLGTAGFLPNHEFFKAVSDVGFYFLMFLAGMEVDLKILINTDKKIIKKSIIFTLLLYILAAIITYLFNLQLLFIIIIPLISVGILSTLYKEYGKNQSWLNMAMLVGVIGEVVSIALLTILNAYLKHGVGINLVLNLGSLILFLIITTIVFKSLDILFWWFPNIRKILMPEYDKDEKDIRLAMALFCFVISIMIIIDLKVVLGAFIAGTLIPTFFGHNKELPHKLSSFGFGFLVPIFFVYVGSTVNINSIFTPGVIPQIIIITISLFTVRLISSTVFIKDLGIKGMILFSASLSMPLTLLIAVAAIGFETKYITQQTYFSFIFSSLLSAIIYLVIIKIVNIRAKNGRAA